MSENDHSAEVKSGPAPAAPHPLPDSPAAMFWAFSGISMQGFGGVLAITQRELVERKRWMTREEFLGECALAQVLPGPNMVNVSLIVGYRCFGVRGGLAAMAGMLTFPALLVLVLAVAYTNFESLPVVQGALRGMGAVIVSLIALNALKLGGALRSNPMGRAACMALMLGVFVAVALLRLPLSLALLLLGVPAWLWTWRMFRRQLEQERRA